MKIMDMFRKHYYFIKECIKTGIAFFKLWLEWCRKFGYIYSESLRKGGKG